MDSSSDGDTYEQMRAHAAQQWERNCEKFEARIMAVDYSQSPDNRMRPDPSVPWSHPNIVCSECNGTTFYVPRWSVVNGVKERAELVCTQCPNVRVWDWTRMKWLGTG